MVRVLFSVAVVSLVLWVLVKVVFGIVGAAFHLLLVAAVGAGLYALVRAARRTWSAAIGGRYRACRRGLMAPR